MIHVYNGKQTHLDGLFPIGSNGIICVYLIADDDPYGIIGVICNKLQCLLCNYECKHVAYIESYLESDDPPEVLEQIISLLNTSSSDTKSISPMGVSWKKSAFELPGHIKNILRDGVHSFHCNAEGNVILLCELDTHSCTSCKSKLCFEDEKLPLITEQRIFTATGKKNLQSLQYTIKMNNYHTSVRRLKCTNCGLLHHFDGYNSGVLNMGVCLVSYGILRSYMHHFLSAR